jgi:RHS repeat-associated protein
MKDNENKTEAADDGKIIRQEYSQNWSVQIDRMLAYDGWQPIAEFSVEEEEDVEFLVLQRRFYWGIDISKRHGGAGGIGGLYLIKSGGVDYLPTYDGLGNVNGLVKGSGSGLGQVVATFEYDAYGQIVRTTGNPALTPFRYQTKWQLAASNTYQPQVPFDLYDYGLRWYHPDQGRFVNRDPIGEAGGINLYAYVGNDPVNRRDLLGLSRVPFTFRLSAD